MQGKNIISPFPTLIEGQSCTRGLSLATEGIKIKPVMYRPEKGLLLNC